MRRSPARKSAVPTATPLAGPTRNHKQAIWQLSANAVEYNLGETTIVQSNFPEDSRFHNMPVRLNGVIAVPVGDAGLSVVVIFRAHPAARKSKAAWIAGPVIRRVEQTQLSGLCLSGGSAGGCGLCGRGA
ncbi:MAG: hypothetical protein IPM39_27735 [Chloroflexi bacterium]|nr:hypothetical protein [Chloroflexota bacterium]